VTATWAKLKSAISIIHSSIETVIRTLGGISSDAQHPPKVLVDKRRIVIKGGQ
jgi:hypothetical protein